LLGTERFPSAATIAESLRLAERTSGRKTSLETERLLTVEEVAEALRITEKSLRRWIIRGQVEAIKLPNNGLRIRYSEYQRLVGNQKTVTQVVEDR
jgi:excisionase family DNA binding protein